MADSTPQRQTRTGGREATTGVIPGRYALSVGNPDLPAPVGWRWTALSDVARLESGHTPSRNFPEYWNGDIPWIGIRDATENHGRTLHRTHQTVTQAGIDNSSARILPVGTVCLSRTASVGYVVVMGRPMATSQDFVNWVCSDAIDHRFLKYVLLSENDSMLRFASGTTHQTIYYPEVKAFHVCLPPLAEQRAIAHILGALDDKIELNRRMNETLEAVAQALFKSWFVDFDPVRAKAEDRDTGLEAVAGMVPDGFEETELGEIPAGWSTSTLGEVTTKIGSGATPRGGSAVYIDDGVALIRSQNVYDSLFVWEGLARITDEAAAALEGVVVEPEDVLLNITGASILRTCVVDPDVLPARVNQHVAIIRAKPHVPARYLHFHLLQSATKSFLMGMDAGASRQAVTKGHIESVPLIVPPTAVLDAFAKAVCPMFAAISNNSGQSRTLAALRDALLPKLISGELRVADAEKLVEAAA